MNCKKCGSPLSLNDTTCPICGTTVINQVQNTRAVNSDQNKNQAIPNSGINQINNQNEVSANGLQLGALFSQKKVNKAPLINPSMMNQSNIVNDDFFSSPKVNVDHDFVNQPMNQQPMINQNVNPPKVNKPYADDFFSSNREKSNKINMKFVIISFAVLVLVLVGFFSFKYFQGVQEKRENLEKEEIKKEVEDNINDYEQQREEKAEQMKKNVTLAEENLLYDGSLLFIYENNNNVVSAVEIELEFYDKEENLLGTAKEYAYPAPYSKFLVKFNKLKVKEGYDKYKVNLTVNDYDLIPVTIDTSKFVISDKEEVIAVQYKNESEDSIDNLELCILYYNAEKIVGAECSSNTNISPGNSADFKFEYSYANKYEGLIFDTYRFAVSAYNKPKSDY